MTSQIANPSTRGAFCSCGGSNRYVILVIGVLYFSALQSSVITYNAVYVPMMDKTTSPLYNSSLIGSNDSSIDWASSDLPIADRRFTYGFLEKSLSFAGAFGGSMAGTFPISMLIRKYGAHKIMTLIGILSTVLISLTPIAVATSFPLFVVLRIFAGLAISNLFPVAGIMVNEWAATSEKGFFVAVLSGYVEISAMFTMPISGLVAVKVSWPAVFYLHGLLCGILTILWAVYYRDQPQSHPFLADKEWKKISFGKIKPVGKVTPPIGRILSSFCIWAVWCSVLGNFLVAQFSISYSPMYLNYVLGYEPITAGVITIAPLALQLLIKFLTGLLSDRIRCISELGKLKLFNSLALLGAGLFFILLSVIPPGGHVGDVVLALIPIALLGFSSGGFPKAAVIVARQHSPFVMSIVQITACLALMCGSFVVPALTSEDSFDSWRKVFTLYAAVLVLSNTVFIALAKADPAKWTNDEPSESEIAVTISAQATPTMTRNSA